MFNNKVNKNSFDLKILKMKTKRTEVLNLTHAGLPTREVSRISGVSKITVYKVKKKRLPKCLKLMKRPLKRL